MDYKRILTVQDISCVGQCSMTVALPILSACGHEVCVLPTAVLSCHTGGFQKPHIHNLEADIPQITAHWKREGITFDIIYIGYLGSVREIEYARKIGEELLSDGGKLIIDPAMADLGKLYHGFDSTYVNAMKQLCKVGHIVIPNLTEAAMLSGLPYCEDCDEGYISELMAGLDMDCVILTGVEQGPEQISVQIAYDGQIERYTHKRFRKSYHGTGDIFAAAFVGALACGKDISDAVQIGADFTCKCIEYTQESPAHWYGVKFEPALPDLIQSLTG